jgi:hypothetical protein
MKKLIATLCLMIAVLLGSVGAGANFNFWEAYKNGDYATALREWKPLAKQGDPFAQTIMGLMHMTGKGFPKDYKNYKIAVKWYTLAAEQGFAVAQEKLGAAYFQGRGVLKDFVYAYMWWNIAAANGDTDAAKRREKFAAPKLTPSQISEAQKLARECIRKKYKGC